MLGERSRAGQLVPPSVGHAAGPDGSRRDTEGGHSCAQFHVSRSGPSGALAAAGLPRRLRRGRLVRHRGARGRARRAPVAPRSPAQQLVVLEDDKKLQNSDNIVPAINTKAADAAADRGTRQGRPTRSTPPKLIALNKAVDVDRKTPKVAAEEFATANNAHRGHRRGRRRQHHHRRGQLQREPDARRAVQDRADRGRLHATVQQIGNRELYEPALEKGDIQVVPEYAASIADFLNKKVNGANAPAASSSPRHRQDDDGAQARWARRSASRSASRRRRRTRTRSR